MKPLFERMKPQLPAIGELKIPTAISAHNSRNTPRIATQRITLPLVLVTFLRTISIPAPTAKSMSPMIKKSAGDQFTSDVNCIAISGTSNRVAITPRMIVNLLVSMVVNLVCAERR